MSALGTIQLQNVAKSFRIYHARNVKSALVRMSRLNAITERREVLKDVSFTITPGERVGLVGRNGAGKSTLFRLMSRILKPDQGTITMSGRVSPLIDLTAGLHADLDGRDNMMLNAAVLGLSRTEIKERAQEIIDFAGIADFMDTPVRYYSQGMRARLAFSIAVHISADILLIDEALSVGDAAFREKCMHKMKELTHTGVTIVFVSHEAELIESFCDRAIWLEEGTVVSDGEPTSVLEKMNARITTP